MRNGLPYPDSISARLTSKKCLNFYVISKNSRLLQRVVVLVVSFCMLFSFIEPFVPFLSCLPPY